jgi:hypothetical protein
MFLASPLLEIGNSRGDHVAEKWQTSGRETLIFAGKISKICKS